MKFISEISSFYLVLLAIIAFAIAFFLYSGKEGKSFSKSLKWVLISLRTLGLVFVGILFLGIFLQTNERKLEKPILINLIDNSQSMKNYADSSQVEKGIEDFLQLLENQKQHGYIVKNYLIGEQFRNFDSLDFSDSKTDLSKPFTQLYEQFYNSNIGAITLISDGNYNEGNHPIYEIGSLTNIPIYTLGVGDTISKKDILIKHIQSNDFVYLNNSFPIEALIEAKKLGTKHVKVRLFHQKKEIASQEIHINPKEEYYKVNFEIEAKMGGVQRYDIVVDAVQGEFTTKNNSQGFYIDVINDTKKVLLVSGAPHPDIAALKSVIEKEKINQVEVKLLSNWDQNTSKYDLVVFHNPLVGNATQIAEKIIQQKVPMLVVLGEQSNFKTTPSFLGMKFQSNQQRDDNTPVINSKFEFFTLSKEAVQQIAQFPPLVSTFGRMQLQPNATVLAYQGVAGIQKETAQIYFHDVNKVKVGVIFGEGLWRWKLHDFKTKGNSEAFDELIGKITRYLTVKKNNNPFRVTIPKRTKTDEPLILKAEVFNAAMENITTSPVTITLTDEQGKKQVFDFSVIQNYYSLNLGKMVAGDYAWEATTNIDGKKHTQSGQLVIEANNIEQITNTANYETLMQLSEKSDGRFYPFKHYQQLIDELQARDDIRPLETQKSSVKNLIDFWWLLLLIAGIFGGEWFIKKYNGGY